MSWTITNGLLSFTQMLMFSLFISRLSENKYSKAVSVISMLILQTFLLTLYRYLGLLEVNKISAYAYKIILFSICGIVITKVITKNSIRQISKYIFLMFIFIIFSEYAGIFLYAALIGIDFSEFYNGWLYSSYHIKMIGIYLFCTIFATSSSVYLIYREKTPWNIKTRAIIYIVIFFVFQLEILMLIYMRVINNPSENTLFLGAFNSFFIVAVYYGIQFDLVESLKVQEQKREIEFLKIQKENIHEYYNLAAVYLEDTRKLRHDIVNQLQTALLMLENNSQSSREMLLEIEHGIKLTKVAYNSGNIIVDTVLTIKESKAKNNNIDIDYTHGENKVF